MRATAHRYGSAVGTGAGGRAIHVTPHPGLRPLPSMFVNGLDFGPGEPVAVDYAGAAGRTSVRIILIFCVFEYTEEKIRLILCTPAFIPLFLV